MIDHTGHPHPSTPKARALCRANGGTGSIAVHGADAPKSVAKAKITAKPTRAPSLTSHKIPMPKKVEVHHAPTAKKPPTIINIDTGKPISREEAAKRMFGTAGVAQKKAPAKKKVAPVRVDSGTPKLRNDPAYKKDYERGWKAAAKSNDLSRADKRGEPDAFYDGFSDRSIGEPKYTRADERDANNLPVESAPVSLPSNEGITKSLKSGIASQQSMSGGAISETTKVKFKDGTFGVQKRGGGLTPAEIREVSITQQRYMSTTKQVQDAEELGSIVARSLGVDAPEVVRVDPNTTIQRFRTERIAAGQNMKTPRVEELAASDDGMLIGLADQLVGNADRNFGNWMAGEGNKLVAIDFGNSWSPYIMERSPDRPTINADDHFAYRFNAGTPTTGKWSEFDIHPEDMARAADILLRLKPEFDKRGQTKWWEWSNDKLKAMTPYAKGKKRRIK